MQSEGAAKAMRDVHTYHCICTNLIFASTQQLEALPRRAAGEDRAHILPLPSLPSLAEDRADSDGPVDSRASSTDLTAHGNLLSVAADKKPLVVRREDGFEKRYIQRCSRCNITIGYHLDWAQYAASSQAAQPASGPNTGIIYLLPGGFQSTNDMAAGKDMSTQIQLPQQITAT